MSKTSDFAGKIREVCSIESLAAGNTCIHRLHPTVKILSALFFLAAVLSLGRYEFMRLTPYVFYPVVLMAAAEIPYPVMLRRFALALPFCLLAGASNLFFDAETAFFVGGVPVSRGVLSLSVIILRAYLCVTAVLILAAVTPFTELAAALRRMRVPEIQVRIFEVTYRYLGTLFGEAASMSAAYSLRSGGKRGLEIRHMGSFIGQLLLRSLDRAERVYNAMKCRGYTLGPARGKLRKLNAPDILFLLLVCGLCLLLRAADVPGTLGGWIARLW